ncbi:Protease 3 precursor [compost metagenome]
MFLGTERFAADRGLMAFVQRHGGQVNAQTCERTTDYFFELPTQAFAEGLERLADMLAHPRMDLDDQHREREVLHAEFIAWSQDAAAQQQLALLDGLSDAHPLRGFHAGNRDSLAVPQPEFQQALQDYYQRYYQTGQMTLSLVGPQSLDELRLLAEAFGNVIAKGEKVAQQAPTPLMAGADNRYQQTGEHRLDLLFALEALPCCTLSSRCLPMHRRPGLASNCRTGWAFSPDRIGAGYARNMRRCASASKVSAVPCNWPDRTAKSARQGYPKSE